MPFNYLLSLSMAGLIAEYGLHWERDKVDWGRGRGRKRRVVGVPAKNLRDPEVDFAGRAAIYVLHTEDFEIVYIGQAGAGKGTNLGKRLADHRRDHLAHRWTRFSWFSIAPGAGTPGKVTVLNQLEAVLIATAEPRLNRRGGNWHGAKQFLQRQ